MVRLDDIRAELRGHVHSAPRVRFTPAGETLWEFSVRLAAHWTETAELVVVRVPDQHYALLQRWVHPGRQTYLRGKLRLVRWQTKSGQPRAQLLLEAVELMPLDERALGSAPAAIDYRSPPMRQEAAIPPRRASTARASEPAQSMTEQVAVVRRMLDEAEA